MEGEGGEAHHARAASTDNPAVQPPMAAHDRGRDHQREGAQGVALEAVEVLGGQQQHQAGHRVESQGAAQPAGSHHGQRDQRGRGQEVQQLAGVTAGSIDEFSELLSSEVGNANLSALESITRVGGGLGVHLLLVTQNFENQLPSQIAANAGLRICFRVQEVNHSKAVLNSPEAATIPKERIGRAFLRSHGVRVVEFQAARVAGPRPGREAVTSSVSASIVPFSTVADATPQTPIVDVPAADTDMYAIVGVIQSAAARTGWTAPVVPWPKDLPRNLNNGGPGCARSL